MPDRAKAQVEQKQKRLILLYQKGGSMSMVTIPYYSFVFLIITIIFITFLTIYLFYCNKADNKLIENMRDRIAFLQNVLNKKEDFEYKVNFRKFLASLSEEEE